MSTQYETIDGRNLLYYIIFSYIVNFPLVKYIVVPSLPPSSDSMTQQQTMIVFWLLSPISLLIEIFGIIIVMLIKIFSPILHWIFL